MESLLHLEALAGLFVVALTFVWLVIVMAVPKRKLRREQAPPQPPNALPLLGHLHLLSKRGVPLYRTLAAMADRHGPIFMIRLGRRRLLVVSSYDAARECFASNDRVLASRPRSAAAENMGYDLAMLGFAPYGPYWRSVRKLATVELLSSARVAILESVRSTEINRSISEVHVLWKKNGKESVVVDMKQWFKDLSFAIIVRVVAGKECPGTCGDSDDVKQLKQGIGEFFRLLGAPVLADFFPSLRWMDLGGYEKAMKTTAKLMDTVLAAWLEEHRSRRLCGQHGDDRDFMGMMLTATDSPEFSEFDVDTIIKANSLSMILGGNDTTSISLTKNLAILLSNPDVLKKVQDELDLHVGRHRNVEEADIENLIYLQAIVKETFRLHPTSELSQPHEATEDCSIAGFDVPAGTSVLANIWKLQRDPEVWPDPEEFKPERFLGSHAHVDVKGRHFELIPFGAGRRMCPAVSFALHVMHLTLARLIHSFELGAPTGPPVDLGESLFSPTPFPVALAPRLAPELYR